MSRLSDAGVVELFDGEEVGGVPTPLGYGVEYGNPERLRVQQGGPDDAFGRAMMNYRSDMQRMPMLTGGARRTRKQKRKSRKSRNTKPKNWRLKVTASIRLRQQRRQ